MKKTNKIKPLKLLLLMTGINTLLFAPVSVALAAETDISKMPLANSTGQTVAPNIQFVLDDSGSMAWEYAPDAINTANYYCRSGRKTSQTTKCSEAEAPYFNSHINTIYYNPKIRYSPVVLPEGYTYSKNSSAGKEMNSANTNAWKSVPNDIYGVDQTGTINLLTGYLTNRWCNNTNNTNDCKIDTDYTYPNDEYYYRRTTSGVAHYFELTPGEYCSDRNLKNCTATDTPTGEYTFPAYIRFCSDEELTVCQKNYVAGSYSYARYAKLGSPAKKASGSIRVASASFLATIRDITVNGVKINNGNITASLLGGTTTLAQSIVNAINGSSAGFTATRDSSTVNIESPDLNAETYNGLTINITYTSGSTHSLVVRNFAGGIKATYVPGTFKKVDIVSGKTYPKVLDRTDCRGETCTYEEEMTNFANWHAYYRFRMSLVKTTVASTLGNLNDNYRLGIFSLNENISDVKVNSLSPIQRKAFLDGLFAAKSSGGTPLRSALAKAGNIYAGKVSNNDPVQYSCQQNFTILATDGYWNGASTGYGGKTYGGDTSVLSPFYSPNNKNEVTLADIAYYYYYTDLRPAGSKNPDKIDVSDNNVPAVSNNTIEGDFANWQHMTTFTLGLGLSGILDYDETYKTTSSGDYFALKQGTVNWPRVVADAQTTIDDLWHTAINGHGQYFSAKDPSSVTSGINAALASISVTTGTGAAAATSNLEPIAGDNYVYVASYRTRWWDGDLSAYTMDLNNGSLSNAPIWSAQSLLDRKVGVNGNTDTRKIYMDGAANSLTDFTWSNFNATQKTAFNADVKRLSQFPIWADSDKTGITGEYLVNYLRGHGIYEDKEKTGTMSSQRRLFRAREHILGDIINAKPEYAGAPNKRYTDTGYNEFKIAQANRQKVVYVAANDGMLHAFNAETGEELWAYVPTDVMSKLYRLADIGYTNTHEYFTDGNPVVADVYDTTAKSWKTILVAGYNSGAKAYYALDVTNPTAPKSLWRKNEANESLGYSYGKPIIGKDISGNWSVLLSSGYNNTTGQGDGKGWLYKVNPMTGSVINKRTTGVGSLSSPSGFAKFNTWVNDLVTDNTILTVYGGDLEGNMFKFDMKTSPPTLTRLFNIEKPITVAPELGLINNTRAIMFSTGKFIGQTDLSNTDKNYIFAIKDDEQNTFVSDVISKLQHQTITDATATTRTGSTDAVDWVTKYGWYVDMKDRGERGNIDPVLQLGTLTVVANVPISEACNPSGYSWLYQFNYKDGTAVQVNGDNSAVVGEKLNSTTVGLNIVRLPNGTVVILRSRSDSIKPDTTTMKIGSGTGAVKRVYWRQMN